MVSSVRCVITQSLDEMVSHLTVEVIIGLVDRLTKPIQCLQRQMRATMDISTKPFNSWLIRYNGRDRRFTGPTEFP